MLFSDTFSLGLPLSSASLLSKNPIPRAPIRLHSSHLDEMLWSARLSRGPSVSFGKCHTRSNIHAGKDKSPTPNQEPPLLVWKAGSQGEQPAVFPGGDRNWEWPGEAAERGPDAAPAEGKPGAWSSGWRAHLPGSVPSSQPQPGPSHPEASPRPRSRCLRARLSCIQHEVPSLPPVRNSVLWSC